MSDAEFQTVYGCGWVRSDDPLLPAVTRAAMMRDDIAAKRESDELAAQAEDRREDVAHRCRREGRDTSMAGVFGRAERGFRQTDYRDAQEAFQRDVAPWASPPVQRSRRVLDDGDIRAMAVRAASRRLERSADLERAEREKLQAQARARHPASGAWPAWSRP